MIMPYVLIVNEVNAYKAGLEGNLVNMYQAEAQSLGFRGWVYK